MIGNYSTYERLLPPHFVEHGIEVAVIDLLVDQEAQRSLNERRAKTYAANLVREALGSLVVSRRNDGRMFIVDGMHRHRVCQLVGIGKIRCEIHHGLTQQQEAVLFLIKNKESTKPNAFEVYKIGLTARQPLYVDTQKVLDQHNLRIGGTSTNTIAAVAGVLNVTKQHGPEILNRAITVAEAAWGRSSASWDGMLLGGLGMLLGRHGDLIDDGQLANKVAKKGMAQLWVSRVVTLASAGGTQHTGTGGRISIAYKLFLNEWNKGRRVGAISPPSSIDQSDLR